MRVKRSLRTGTAWAAAAALLVAPLVVAPLVSAAEPADTQAPAEAPASVAAAAAPAEQVPAERAPVERVPADAPADEAPAAEEPAEAPAEAPAPASEAPAEPTAPAEPAEQEAPSSDAPTQASRAGSAPTWSATPSGAPPAPAEKPADEPATLSLTPPVAPLAAAAPGTLVAKVVADRTNTGSQRPKTGEASGVAGATLALEVQTQTRRSTGASWGSASGWSVLSTCVSAADGTCSLEVPAIDTNLKRYSSARIQFTNGGPEGTALTSVGTGNYGGSTTSTQTLTLIAGQLPASGKTVQVTNSMASGLSTGQQAVFTVVRKNRTVAAKCGLKVGLLIDQSKSISDASGGVSDLKAAARAFVEALTGTPSAILIRNFADGSPNDADSEVGLTPTATATDAKPLYDAIDRMDMGTYTNWDAGLWRMQGLGLDAVVVVTDGVPTAYMNGNEDPNTRGYNSTVGTVQHAVWSANALKSQGTKVIAVGAGESFTNAGAKLNLTAMASADESYVSGNLSTLKATLKDLAEKDCKGTVNVIKRVVNDGATTTTEANSTPGAGFNFKMGTGAYQATNATGGTSFEITSNSKQTFTEEQRSDYDIVAQGGKPAVCTNGSGAPVAVTGVGDYAFSIATSTADKITCTVYNKPKPKQASLVIRHEWVDEANQPLNDADVAEVLAAPVNGAPSLKVGTGSVWTNAPAYDSTVTTTTAGGATKLVEGDTVTVAVRTDPGQPKAGITCSTALVSVTSGSQTNPTSLTGKLAAGSGNVFTIKHKLSCTTQLTLVKELQKVQSDPTQPSAWTLKAGGQEREQGTAFTVTPGTAYALTETGGPAAVAQKAWEQTDLRCNLADALKQGSVTVPRGTSVTCTFVNSSLAIDVTKRAWTTSQYSDAAIATSFPDSKELFSGALAPALNTTFVFTIKNTGFLDYRVSNVTDSKLGTAPVTCTQNPLGTWKSFGSLSQSERTIARGTSLYCKASGPLAF